MRRALIVVVAAALVIVPGAGAWTWPVKGPVLQKFVLGDDPYAAGQHRGIEIGAPTGEPVLAPSGGTVSFAGTVPGSGRVVTIQTADGYSVTLTHLGSTSVRRGDTVDEGASVGTVGPSGEVEHDVPYLHLGIRHSEDPNGYVDPLLFLPAPAGTPAPAPAAPATPGPSPTAAPPAPVVTASSPAASGPAAFAVPAASTTVGRPQSAGRPDRSRPAALQLGEQTGAARRVRHAAPATVRVPAASRAAKTGAPVSRPARVRTATIPAPGVRSARGEEPRPTSAMRLRLETPVASGGSNGSVMATGAEKRSVRVTAWLWLATLLPIASAIAGVPRLRRAASVSPDPAPIIAANVALLPDNPDLLRELDPAHRARVHDDRRGHPRAPSPPARRRDLLPDRYGRECLRERARGRGGRCLTE